MFLLLGSSFFSLSCLLASKFFWTKHNSSTNWSTLYIGRDYDMWKPSYSSYPVNYYFYSLGKVPKTRKGGHISGKSHANLKHISDRYEANLSHIWVKAQANLRHILEKVWVNLKYQAILHICLQSSYFSIASVVQTYTCFHVTFTCI